MRIANGMDSATSIPSDKLDEGTNLLSKPVEYVKAAEDKYAKVRSKSGDHKKTIADLRQEPCSCCLGTVILRIWWISSPQ